MHAIIRSYSDPNLADILVSHRDEVEEVIRAVPGVRSYTLMRTPDGCAAVVVGDDEGAIRGSTEAAAQVLREKAPSAAAPTVVTGEVIVQLGAGVTA